MQRRSDTAAQTQTAPATAAGNFRLESIPALLEVGVQAEHWSAAQQLARRRVLSRLLQALLDLPEPSYAHHRLVLDRDGRKLSKRDGAVTLEALRAEGVTVGDIRARLGL